MSKLTLISSVNPGVPTTTLLHFEEVLFPAACSKTNQRPEKGATGESVESNHTKCSLAYGFGRK